MSEEIGAGPLGAFTGVATALFKGAVDKDNSRSAAIWNQQMYERNTAANFRYSQIAQRNAAANEAAGLLQAGLNPNLANGAAAAPMAAGSQGTRTAPQLDLANSLLAASALKLQNAQADKTEAEASEIKQRLGEKQTAGMSWSHNLENLYTRMAENASDDNQKAYYESMAKEAHEAGSYATGAADALKGFQQLEAEGYESRERILRSRLNALVVEGQYDAAMPHGDFFEALRDLPVRESNKVLAEIAKFGADKENLEALKKLATSQTELNQAQKRQVEAMAERLESYNLPALLKKGDYRGFAAAIIGLLIEGVSHKGL